MKKMFFTAFAVLALISCSKDDESTPAQPLKLSENFTRLRVDTSAQLTDVSFADENYGYVCGSNGVLLHTKDGGVSWTYPRISTDQSLLTVFTLDHEHTYTARKGIYTNNTQGNFEYLAGQGDFTSNIFTVHFFNSSNGLFLMKDNIRKTSDAGQNWEIVFENEDEHLKELITVDKNTLYAYGGETRDGLSTSTVLKSVDGGLNWTNLHRVGPEIEKMYFFDAKIGFLADFNRKIYKTVDGGNSWELIGVVPEPKNGGAVSCLLYVSEKQFLLSNYNGEIFSSEDGGLNWNKIFEHDGAIFNIERIGEAIYIVGDNGLILKNQ